ncbi:MAG TPA: hypothetical protein VHN39_05240, partial [Phenylobacterium sp.]|nr:hypothetical protein [Phenylobacterium sp.]
LVLGVVRVALRLRVLQRRPVGDKVGAGRHGVDPDVWLQRAGAERSLSLTGDASLPLQLSQLSSPQWRGARHDLRLKLHFDPPQRLDEPLAIFQTLVSHDPILTGRPGLRAHRIFKDA